MKAKAPPPGNATVPVPAGALDERVLAQALDRRHLATGDGVDERDAGQDGDAVELHRARAAVTLVARDLGAGQTDVLAQGVCERSSHHRRFDVVPLSVYDELHRGQPPVVTAKMSASWIVRAAARVT
jgi:hypothetical protein